MHCARAVFYAALLAVLVTFPFPAQSQSKQTTYALIRCESIRDAESFCKADTYPGVRLLRELSSRRCIEGRTFGFERGGIWVNGGCAAEFEIGRRNSNNRPDTGLPNSSFSGDRLITCESINDARNYCPADTRNGVRLLRQFSQKKCVEGNSWGYSNRGIWTDHGCRGEFELLRRERSPLRHDPLDSPGNSPFFHSGSDQILQTLICKSIEKRQAVCPADVGRHRVELIRQISRQPCVLEQSWGFDQNRVWVNNGCRAEFAVVRVREPVLIACESTNNRRQYCPIESLHNVRLSRQRSRSPCIEGQTWGYDRNAIWVDQGCRADFLAQ